MNKQEFYEKLSHNYSPNSYDQLLNFRQQEKRDDYVSGLQKGEELAKEFAEWVHNEDYEWNNVVDQYDVGQGIWKTRDQLWEMFIQTKTK